MSTESVLTIIAILLAPLVALQISEILNEKKEIRRRRLDIFRVLMETRGVGLISAHVRALNRIDIEFYKDKKVIAKWREYQDHLSANSIVPHDSKEQAALWLSQQEEKLADMLYEMSKSLDYNFDKVHIKRGHYFPQKFIDTGNENMIIRKGWVDVFTNKRPFPISIHEQNPEKEEGKTEEA